ncbi:MAG: hypothetical protein NTX55_02230 [Candidatus Parcubacteria bacterium]|nr:hypothetical protein [Candidatus Parcubacteria bacterium]
MKNKGKVIAVLEISSASVGGALIRQNKNNKPEIISLTRVPVNFLFDVNFDAFWRCTLASLKKVIKILLKNYPSGPDVCLCVFLSPWFLSQTKIINIRREKNFKVTRDFFENLMKSEEESFKNQRTTQLKGEPGFIEHEIIKTELNGYYTKSPIGKFTKTIRLHIYMSLGMGNIKTKIEEEILENFGDIPLSFGTFPFIAFQVLSSNINSQEGLILVDIGGEITDISLIRKNCLEETISFPRGKNFLLRKIASEFKTFSQEADSILQTYLKGHSLKGDSEKISKIIEEVKKDWGNFFETAIKSIAENPPTGGPLPQNLFLMGDEAIGGQFIKCAEEERFSQYTLLGKPFITKRFMDENQLDVFLMLEALFANKF